MKQLLIAFGFIYLFLLSYYFHHLKFNNVLSFGKKYYFFSGFLWWSLKLLTSKVSSNTNFSYYKLPFQYTLHTAYQLSIYWCFSFSFRSMYIYIYLVISSFAHGVLKRVLVLNFLIFGDFSVVFPLLIPCIILLQFENILWLFVCF